MLALSRKAKERVYLRPRAGGKPELTVVVTKVDRGRVILAFDLPPDWEIYREEIDPKRNNNPEGVSQ